MQTTTENITKMSRATTIIALALGAGACFGNPDDGGGVASSEPSSNGSGEQALSAQAGPVSWYRWSKGDPQVTMKPHSTHICGLSLVRGELAKNTSLRISQSGGNWVMGGDNPGGNSLQMEAVCEPLSAFKVNAGSTVLNLGETTASVDAQNSTKSIALPAHSAPVLLGVLGEYNGGGEKGLVTIGPSPTVVAQKGTATGTHQAFASSVSFGQFDPVFMFDGVFGQNPPTVQLPKNVDVVACVKGPGGECGEIAPLATSFCYLTSVSGDFNGADEWVQVFPSTASGFWVLQGDHGGGSVFAEANCLLNDQRHTIEVIH